MFCQEVIRPDIEYLKHTPTRNAHVGPIHDGETVEFDPTGEHGRIEEVFGQSLATSHSCMMRDCADTLTTSY